MLGKTIDKLGTEKTTEFVPYAFPADTYTLGVQNFIVLLDLSSSMESRIGGRAKIEIAKDFLKKLGLTLPENQDLKYAIRTFGHNPLLTIQNTRLVKGFTRYHAVEFNSDCFSINKTGGQSPLSLAIEASDADIGSVQGDIVLLVLSDGVVLGEETARSAKDLKLKYGHRLAIFPVGIGRNPAGAKNMQELAWIGETGFYRNAADIKTNRDMADYVRRVFLKKYPDTDGDSVVDIRDECPGTPAGVIVNARGCWVLNNIEYEFDKWVILTKYFNDLERVAGILKANPDLKVEIEGHTDAVGTEIHNLKLSLKRAEAVRQFLMERGIADDRLYTRGYGFSRPIASNQTEEGRASNRRVELQPIKIELVGN